MIKVELAFTTVAEAAAFFVAASGAAPVSPLPAIVEPPAPAPKAQHQRPPTEPKITVPNASSAGASVSGESKTGAQPSGPAPGEAGKAAAAAAPAGATHRWPRPPAGARARRGTRWRDGSCLNSRCPCWFQPGWGPGV